MKRAQSDEQKEERRKAILNSAREALDKQDYRDIRLQDLADSMGLVKGSFYRYFPTKQDLFMTLYLEELDEWLVAWSTSFSAVKYEEKKLEKIMLDSLVVRPRLIRLIGSFPGDLEPELSDEGLKNYKRFLKLYLVRSTEALGLLATRLGVKALSFLISLFVLIQGAAPLAFPIKRVAAILKKEKEFAILRFEFREIFAPLLNAVCRAYLGTDPI